MAVGPPPPQVKKGLAGVAAWINTGGCQRVGLLTGAGISCAAGIPDFRSPGGVYATLRPELLTATAAERATMARDPTAVVSWELFQRNAFPYLEVRRPFILGSGERRWKATAAHYFAKAAADRGLLQRVYTQNIDGLDYQVGLDEEKIVACHGSIATPQCERCGAPQDAAAFREDVRTKIRDIYGGDGPEVSTPICCSKCVEAAVKPNTVLFGRSLPERFHALAGDDMRALDCLIIAGTSSLEISTSLQVFPAAGLVNLVRDDCLRVVFDRQPVGAGLGLDFQGDRDLLVQGDIDMEMVNFMAHLGWLESTFLAAEKTDDGSDFRAPDLPDASKATVDAALKRTAPPP